MNKFGYLMLRLGLGLALVGCATADPSIGLGESEETTEAPIIGGQETTGDPAIAGLLACAPGATSCGMCTATLVAPSVLLTAAHCVDPAVVGEGMVFEARFGPNLRTAPADMRVPVKEVHWDTAFNKNNLPGGHDIAVAILAKPAPGNITPIPYNKNAVPDSAVGGNVRVVGYGLNNGFDQEGTSAGIKRQANIVLASVTDSLLGLGKTGLTICNGDSGGPALLNINGKETVISVNSFGIIFCLGQASATNIHAYPEFLKKWIDDQSCQTACPAGKECGLNECGSDCGRCDAGEQCSAGVCVPAGPGGPGGPGGNANCPSEQEGNDDVTQAEMLCDGNAIFGTIGGPNDTDWFQFDIKPGTTYTAFFDNVSDKYSATLYKKSAKTGNIVKVGDLSAAGPNLVTSKRTSDGGLYYVQIRGANGGPAATNQYGLYLLY